MKRSYTQDKFCEVGKCTTIECFEGMDLVAVWSRQVLIEDEGGEVGKGEQVELIEGGELVAGTVELLELGEFVFFNQG